MQFTHMTQQPTGFHMNHKIEQKLKISQMKKQNYNENLMRIKTKMKSKRKPKKLGKKKPDLQLEKDHFKQEPMDFSKIFN